MAKASIKSFQGQLSLPFELGENMSAGDPFYVCGETGSSKIFKCSSQAGRKADVCKGYYNCACQIDSSLVVLVYRDLAGSNYGRVVAGRIKADNSITWGTPYSFWNSTAYYIDVCSHAANAFCVTFKGSGNQAVIKAGTVDPITLNITMGTSVTLSVGACYYNCVCSPSPGKVVCIYRDGGLSNYLMGRSATITGTTINAPGAATTLLTGSCSYMSICSPDTDKIAFAYYYSSKGYAKAATLTGTTINAPGVQSEFCSSYVYTIYIEKADTDKIVVIFRNASDSYKPHARCTTITGSTLDPWGTDVKLAEYSSYYQAIGVLEPNEVVFMFTADASPYKVSVRKASISGKTITLGCVEMVHNDRSYYIDCVGLAADKYALFWYEVSGALMTEGLVVEGRLNTIPQCLGLLSKSGLLGEIKRGDLLNSVTKALSGLTIGRLGYIQNDGSISSAESFYPIIMAYETDEAFISKTLMG